MANRNIDLASQTLASFSELTSSKQLSTAIYFARQALDYVSNQKSLMLWADDFKDSRDWGAICEALGIPTNTTSVELAVNVIAKKEEADG